MRAEYYDFSMRQLLGAYAKLLYEMSPGNKPFRADDIMDEAREAFQPLLVHCSYDDRIIIEHSRKEVEDFFHKLFEDKPGFNLLNYTKNLMRTKFTDAELAEKPLDEIYAVMKTVKNDGFRVVDRYTKPASTQEEYDNDFIDLDAFIGNFICALINETEPDDCFLCKRVKSSYCNKCYVNESFKNYYVCDLSPSGKNRTVCQIGCPKGLKICCEDCKKDEKYAETYAKDCPYACNETPDKCEHWKYIGDTPNYDILKKERESEEEFCKQNGINKEDTNESNNIREKRDLAEFCDSVPVQPSDH